MQRPKKNSLVGHLVVSLAAISIFLGNISHSGLWYPDAPSHALNGAFYKDMIEEGGVLHPRSYAERYYVQYPNLTVGIYPPVFYTIEALFFKLFGVSPLVARLAVLLFTLLGVNMFFLLSRLWFPFGLSVVGSILYLLQPAMLFGQKNVMLEIPALAMSIVALYCIYIGTERGNSWALFSAPLFMALAFLTKQSAIFLLPVFCVWMILGRKWNSMRSGYFISGVLIGTVIILPWVFVNLTIGRFYVVASAFQGYHLWSNFLYYLRHSSEIISYPLLFLSILSLILFKKLKNQHGYKLAVLWGCSVLFLVSVTEYKEPRYAIFLVPAVVILSMQVIWLFKESFTTFFQGRKVYAILMIILICLHLNEEQVMGGREILGFHQPADFIVKDLDCVSVLYDGYFDSNFIFHMRARDKDRRVFVFRASKVVFSGKWTLALGYNELIGEVSEFYDILDRYSIKYIVQEERDLVNTPANRRLREWIQEAKFKLVQKYSIPCTGLKGFGNLLVFEYLDYEAKPIRQVELDMPMLGRKIRVRVETRN